VKLENRNIAKTRGGQHTARVVPDLAGQAKIFVLRSAKNQLMQKKQV